MTISFPHTSTQYSMIRWWLHMV